MSRLAKFEIRSATPADALCLGALATQVFFDTYATSGINADLASEAKEHYSESAFARRLASSAVEISVVEIAGKLVGFIDLQRPSVCPVPAVIGPEVLRLYVQAPFQGRGLGRALLGHAEDRARAQGARVVWLTAWVGNSRALTFYPSAGYQKVGTTPYVINGKSYENDVFAKQLDQSGAFHREDLVPQASPASTGPSRPTSIRMGTHLREADPDDAPAIAAVVQAGFIAHVAPDWELPARQDFLRDTTAEKLAARIAESSLVVVYEDAAQVVGVIAMPRPTLVQLFFVAPGQLRRGIGRSLWEAARAHVEERHPEVKTIELNASPYAVKAYRALGFFPISQPYRRNGAVATRMACWLPGRALARAEQAGLP
jgi:GNAT superfamily N-acetyltransferase